MGCATVEVVKGVCEVLMVIMGHLVRGRGRGCQYVLL